jgi:hypothetical protein
MTKIRRLTDIELTRIDANRKRLAAVRDRLAELMGWTEKIGSTGHTLSVIRSVADGTAMAVSAERLEQIAERLTILRMFESDSPSAMK